MKISSKKKMKKMSQSSEKMNNRNVLNGAEAQGPKVFGWDTAEECFQSCRSNFTFALGIHTYEDTAVVLETLCTKLLDHGVSELMTDLYCCDSKRCGLYVDGNDSGQDPMVKEIISQCSNIGFNGIKGPGPLGLAQCPADDRNPYAAISIASDGSDSGGFSAEGAKPTGTVSTTPETGSSRPPTTSTGSSSSSPTTKAVVDYHSSDISSASSNDLNDAGKIAVGICSTLAALALIFTVWCIRRRKRSAKGYMQTPPMTRAFKAHYQEPSDSHASLISTPPPPPPPLPPPPRAAASTAARPSQSLTPPMRLSDRRFLPSASSPSSVRSFSAPPYSSQPDLAMPQQPASSAYHTSRNFAPHEKCETMSSIESNCTDAHNYHQGDDATNAAAIIPRSSVSSSGTTGSSRKVASFVSGCSVATITGPWTPPPPAPPPLSTSRQRLPHETPLLVPAGPPPERALPAAPLRSPPQSPGLPVSPVSPLSPASHSARAFRSVSPIPPAGEIGVAIGMGRGVAGTAPREPSEPAQVRTRGNRGTQDSGWGVWMGGPGDAGAVRQAHAENQNQLADSRRKDQVGVDIVLRELETAKLSGGC